jgi:GMP synthase (glutamine-hydrolysing)
VTRPFLLLSIRTEQEAVEDEYSSFLRFTGLDERELPVRCIADGDLGPIDLADWSGILLGGGPWNAGDPEPTKSPGQRDAERGLTALLDEVVAADFPFLGACYGIGTLGLHQGGTVDRAHPEAVGPLSVALTPEGMADPVLAGLPPAFAAYGGHKEALARVPASATVLATSTDCPVQAFRVGRNVYATQFHPELDVDGVCTRIEVYKDAGYFPPEEAETLKVRARAVEVSHPMRVLSAFVEQHARD